jgi:hypothetical protein
MHVFRVHDSHIHTMVLIERDVEKLVSLSGAQVHALGCIVRPIERCTRAHQTKRNTCLRTMVACLTTTVSDQPARGVGRWGREVLGFSSPSVFFERAKCVMRLRLHYENVFGADKRQ